VADRGTVEAVELHRLAVPLVHPFRASHGIVATRDVLLVRARTSEGDGWGECPAEAEPTYTAEHTDGAAAVLRDHLVPRLLAAGPASALDGGVASVLAAVRGHPMAKAALDTAVLDAQLRAAGRSLAAHLGATATTVPAGVVVGMEDDLGALVARVEAHVAEGYRRVKLKIEPGRDRAPLARVRAAFPALELAADANGAYGPWSGASRDALAALDDLGLQFVEQPLDPDDLVGHARLAEVLATPICLDESVSSVGGARVVAALGAAAALSVKAARLGGYGQARRLHDVAVAEGLALCCGGLLETAIGRRANLALAALPGFTLVGDVSASARYVVRDVTAEPVALLPGGVLAVPQRPGVGDPVDPGALAELAARPVEVLRRA
jgi:O-succinylbenzoate synthase